METSQLWRRIIEIKYGNIWGGWCTNEVTATYGVSLWRSIRQGWPAFFKSTIFKVSNGNRIKVLNFGITCGVRVVLFGRHFQNFIALVVIRILILRMSCLFPNRRLHCDLRFYREPQDWEMEQFDIFWNLTHSMTFTSEGHIKLCWKTTKNKGFKVSKYYVSLF